MSNLRYFAAASLVALSPCVLQAQSTAAAPASAAVSAPVASAVRTQTAPSIDGRLDDAVWAQAPLIDAFTQRDPDEGAAASEATEVRIVYDDEAIYIGARLRDRSPVTARLGRRDMPVSSSDWFRVSLDSYRDRRSAFRFDVNPSGVRRDAILGGGGPGGGFGNPGFTGAEGDLAWDAVWDAETSIDAEGWTAEMRIPFSQLRFTPADEQTWGLQLERAIDRTQELAIFSFTPKSETGGIAAFGSLTGLRGIRPGRPLELIPYVLSQGKFIEPGANPFREDREFVANAGLDARYRITSNLTFSATVNPDFGQVEVDPAIINLSAFETRLEERRPFFVEGANSFRFGSGVAGPGAMNLVYSRRVGRAPQVGVPGSQSDIPETARILGAAKITGKTSTGWSLGLLNAVTGREHGRYLDGDGITQETLVEPLTNYFVARLNRELRQGQSTFGGIVTSVNRDLNDDRVAAALRSQGYSAGLDFIHEWANRSWSLAGFAVGSRISGSPTSILASQRSSVRYYQRPDATSLDLDPTAEEMNGFASTVQIRKASGVHWTGDWWVSTISPGFEANELGFQQRADRHGSGAGIRYTERQPGSFLRTWNVFYAATGQANYDGDFIEAQTFVTSAFQHLSYWRFSNTIRFEPEVKDDRLTRGGPLGVRPQGWFVLGNLTSDPRKSIGGDLELNTSWDRAGNRTRVADLSLSVRTSPRWNLSIGPRLTYADQEAQYVTTVRDAAMTETFGSRYIFAPLKQKQLGVVTRLNYTFTPDLTLELYAQPLVANGEYGTPKQFQRPGEWDFATFGEEVGTISKAGNRYTVDPDGAGPLSSFQVADRTFTTRSLRGNAVLRWEYRPGSTFYLVWQQERLNSGIMDDFAVNRALGSLLDAHGNNVLVLKWSYWFNP